jgi:hypothetical protein
MAVSLQELKAYADASKSDRSCLEKEYELLHYVPTRGQRLSTVCRTIAEPERTQQHKPFLPNDHGMAAVAGKSVTLLQPDATAALIEEDPLDSDTRARAKLGLVYSEPVGVHASEHCAAAVVRPAGWGFDTSSAGM